MIIGESVLRTKSNLKACVRSAKIDDIFDLRKFLEDVDKENIGERTLVADYEFDIEKLIQDTHISESDFIILAIVDGNIAAILDLYDSTSDEDPHPIAEVGVTVKNAYAGQGIASWLMNFTIQRARDTSIKEIILTVKEHNEAAIHIYKKLDFKITSHDKKSDGTGFFWMSLLI